MNKKRNLIFNLVVLSLLVLTSLGITGSAQANRTSQPTATLLLAGLEGGAGSAIGPGGALYVPETKTGKIWRVNPKTGERTLFASGLPKMIPDVGIGGVMDVAFIGKTAYALVTLVGTDVGGSDVVGIYRIDDQDSFTILADIGKFSMENPPESAFFVPTGVQYAIQTYRGGFLVTDGHHNRVLQVTLDGKVSDLIAFDNIVPTGLAVSGRTVYMAEAGAAPHLPEDGKVVSFGLRSRTSRLVASGAMLLVDVEFSRGRKLYALSQGVWDGVGAGSPALPNTGALVKVNRDGTFTVITDGLDRPTSLEFSGTTAYFVTLTGEIWKIDMGS